MTPKPVAIPPPNGNRRLEALPILLWSLLIVPSLLGVSTIAPVIRHMREASRYESNGVTVPLLDRFTGIDWLDQIVGDLVASFGLLQFRPDSPYYWHALDFLAQFGSIYAALLLESCRRAHGSQLLLWTVLGSLLAQLTTAGLLLPVYFYFLHGSTTLSNLVSSKGPEELRDLSTLAVLPAVALSFYVPHFESFLGPDFSARHWWNWVWQLFGLWGVILFLGFSGMLWTLRQLLPMMPTSLSRRVKLHNGLKATRLTAVCLGMVNVGTYWYVLMSSHYSWSEVYVPKYFWQSAADPGAALGTLLQFDYICVFGSALAWLGYQFRDLKTAGLIETSWAKITSLGLFVGVLFGPGSLWWVAWLMREEILTSLRPRREPRKND
ncbi:hypothetical protein VB005_06722 [Metarhizium brunneum]